MDCIVPISGGKDSQACLVLAIDKFGAKNVGGLFCDTQFEHPVTYQHVQFMKTYYGVSIVSVSAGSVYEKIRKYRRFPSFGARHCTDELKLRPSREYYKVLSGLIGGFQVWLGMRSGESAQRAKRYANVIDSELYEPHIIMRKKFPKYLAARGVRFMLPIIDWSADDVFVLLNGKHNPLYDVGFDRVGCFPCLAAGDAHKRKAFDFDEVGARHYADVQTISIEIGKSVWTSKAQGAGCAICSI